MTLALEKACSKLTPKEADRIFFPSSGGKPTEAKKLCASCPVQAMCLAQAIEKGLSGFWAGTTDKERVVMADKWHINIQPDVIDLPVKAKVNGKLFRNRQVVDTVSYLDSLQGPSEVELKKEATHSVLTER